MLWALLSAAACIHLGGLTRKYLWDQAHKPGVLVTLFHTVNTAASGKELALLVTDTLFPFRNIYNHGCKRFLRRKQLGELLCTHVYVRNTLLNPDCLALAPILLSTKELARLPTSPLQVTNLAPEMTATALLTAATELLMADRRPYANCNWLWDVVTGNPAGKRLFPKFWQLIHPACFSGCSQGAVKPRALLEPLFSALSVKQKLKDRNLQEYLRWVLRLCLVGLHFNALHSSDQQLRQWLRDQLGRTLLDIERHLGVRRTSHLAVRDTEYLLMAQCLLTFVTPYILNLESLPQTRTHLLTPDFDQLFRLVSEGENRLVKHAVPSTELHWDLAVVNLYLQLKPSAIPSPIARLSAIFRDPQRLWPIDLIMLARQQFETGTVSKMHQTPLLLLFLHEAVPGSPELQTYLLEWGRTSPDRLNALLPTTTVMLSVPLERRLQFLRETCMDAGGIRKAANLAAAELLSTDPDVPWEALLSQPSRLTRMYWRRLVPTGRLARNWRTGVLQLRLGDTAWFKLFGTLGALSVLLGVPLPFGLDAIQLRLLLGGSPDDLPTLELNPERLEGYFPDSVPKRRRRGRSLSKHLRVTVQKIALSQRTFASTLRAHAVLQWPEIAAILLPQRRLPEECF